ncbi:hypothetical protein ACG7TL_001040 [Trametes sanguinea]
MEQATFDFTASPLYFFLKKQTVEQPTNASRYSTMPTFKPPQSQACPACAAAEPEDVLYSQAWKTAVDVEQQVLDAEQNRPHTASLEMLAIVATVLSDKGQAPVAGRRVGEPADNDSDSVSANLAPKDLRDAACKSLVSGITGDRVKVYMFRHGEWRWVPGKVASLRSFAPRLTASGSTSYPVLLDQQLPRIIMWFDPGEDRIQHSSA